MDVTLSGIVMLVSPLQPENAALPMEVTLLPIVMLVSPVQPENAQSPMEVTLSGIVMLVNPVDPENASPILVTGRLLIVAGITKSPMALGSMPVIVI